MNVSKRSCSILAYLMNSLSVVVDASRRESSI